MDLQALRSQFREFSIQLFNLRTELMNENSKRSTSASEEKRTELEAQIVQLAEDRDLVAAMIEDLECARRGLESNEPREPQNRVSDSADRNINKRETRSFRAGFRPEMFDITKNTDPVRFIENYEHCGRQSDFDEKDFVRNFENILSPHDQIWCASLIEKDKSLTWKKLVEEFYVRMMPNLKVSIRESLKNLSQANLSLFEYTRLFERWITLGQEGDISKEEEFELFTDGLQSPLKELVWLFKYLTKHVSDGSPDSWVKKVILDIDAHNRTKGNLSFLVPGVETQKDQEQKKQQLKKAKSEKPVVECSHCKKRGHTRENCWSLKDDKNQKNTQSTPEQSTTGKYNQERKKKSGSYKDKNVKCLESAESSELEWDLDAEPFQLELKVNGKVTTVEVDTGAFTSFMNVELAEKFDIFPGEESERVNSLAGQSIAYWSKEPVKWQLGEKIIYEKIRLVDKFSSILLGRSTIGKLGRSLITEQIHKMALKDASVGKESLKVTDGPLSMEGLAYMPETVPKLLERCNQVITENLAISGKGGLSYLVDPPVPFDTKDHAPVYVRQYPYPKVFEDLVEKRIKEWLEAEFIMEAPIGCPWNSPLLPIKKGNNDIRLCLDIRKVNELVESIPNSTLPRIRTIIEGLGKFDYISTVDLANRYHQFKLREEDQVKTAFTFKNKQYMFKVAPFGLKTMPGHMQRLMERLFADTDVQPYLDDVVLASGDLEGHLEALEMVLKKLTYEGNLKLNIDKCKFLKKEAMVLGIRVASDGIYMDSKKIEAIANWARPMSGKAMQRFLGTTNFHREFSEKYATIAAPLDECRNMKKIEWTPVRVKAFENLKEMFQRNIKLTQIDWSKDFFVTTDASNFGVGAWLGQRDDLGEIVPITCVSKKLSQSQQRWSATKRELYALKWALEKFRYYLFGRHFIARVDHKPLVEILKGKTTMLTDGWLETFLQFDFDISYIPGEENDFADALSRAQENKGKFVGHISKEEEREREMRFQAEIRGLSIPEESERMSIIEQIHDFGHHGTKVCLDKIREEGYFWFGMNKQVKDFIANCDTCQRFNVEKEGFHPARTVTAEGNWDHIQVDLITSIPESRKGFSNILSVIDVCSGFVVVEPLKNKDMETVVCKLWKIFVTFGTPKIVQSDNGAEFANHLMTAFNTILKIDHRFSVVAKPSTNGLVERSNQNIGRLLRKITGGDYSCWEESLLQVQIALNTSINQRTQSSAFAVMFNRAFHNFFDWSDVEESGLSEKEKVEKIASSWNNHMKNVLPALKERTKQVRQKQTKRLDQRKQVAKLKKGTTVLLRNTQGGKWAPKYEGPYFVSSYTKFGTYKLIDVFGEFVDRSVDISQLKVIPERKDVNYEDVKFCDDLMTKRPRGLVKNWRMEKIVDFLDYGPVSQGFYFVKWKNRSEKDNEWVNIKDIAAKDLVNDYWARRCKGQD